MRNQRCYNVWLHNHYAFLDLTTVCGIWHSLACVTCVRVSMCVFMCAPTWKCSSFDYQHWSLLCSPAPKRILCSAFRCLWTAMLKSGCKRLSQKSFCLSTPSRPLSWRCGTVHEMSEGDRRGGRDGKVRYVDGSERNGSGEMGELGVRARQEWGIGARKREFKGWPRGREEARRWGEWL